LRILRVLILEVAPDVLRNNLAVICIDEVESKVQGSGQTIVKVLLRARLGKNDDFADDGKESFC
jgi:hypothetical protein